MFAGRPFPRHAAAAIAAALVLTVVATLDGRGDGASNAPAASPRLRPEPSIAPFQGLGVWVDIYDKRAWEDPEAAVADMAAHGVRTLYLETSNFSRRFPFVHKPGVTRFVDAAHDAGLQVVAWYLPGFENLRRDTRRSKVAIEFTTPAGNRFDGFGLDIESSEVQNLRTRTRALLELSHRLRAFAGERYPLGAIVVSPRRIVIQPDFWPGFPYAELAELYDAFLPMSYFSYSYPAAWRTRRYIHQQVAIIRREVGDDRVPIHVIGGIARDSTTAATRAFVRALRERGVIGGSFYDWPGIGAGEWDSLAEMPSNGIQVPALPARLGPAELGNVPGSDVTHPREVVYMPVVGAGDATLGFEVFGPQPAEVRVYVNWRLLGEVAEGVQHAWSEPRVVTIPDAMLEDDRRNVVAFVASDAAASWGVRNVSLS